MIESMCQEQDSGALFAFNGIDDPVMWDGLGPDFVPIGIDPPTVAVTMAGVGNGAIVGTYYAYLRFVDSAGLVVSDLSPISAALTASGSTGTITAATNASPIVITSAAHGLPTGAYVKISGVGGNTSANNTWQITAVDANHFSLDNSHGTDDYNGGGTWISGIATINYSNVQVPTEAKVARRQILRNTDGQATVFYVDVDTTNLTGSTFSSSRIDSLLQAREAVPILDSDQQPFANSHAKPLNYYKAVAQQLDRMFACGILEYNIGACSVTFGSKTVVGAGTAWKSTMRTRFLYVDGATRVYEIASVNATAQTLLLTENYADSTSLFNFYAIKPPPAYRRVVAYTMAGQPQSWPATNGLSMPETGDELVGPMQLGSFIFVVEKKHIHKITFSKDPATDGGRYLVSERGAVNPRSWIILEQSAYMLDELGVHKFDLNSRSEPISLQVSSLFRQEREGIDANINWRWKENFHSMLDRSREVMRWFVCLDGNRYPRHAIAYQHRLQRFWIEEYPFPIGGSCSGYINGFNGNPQNYYGGQHARVFAAWSGTLDVARTDKGYTVQGIVTDAAAYSLGDTLASFPATGILNAAVAITKGTGKGQVRRIIGVDGTDLAIDRPWNILPDTSSVYQLGGVGWTYRSSWLRMAPSEKMMQRRFEMLFEPLKQPATADLRFFTDFSDTPDIQQADQKSEAGGGIESVKGSGDLMLDLTKKGGWLQREQPQGKDYFIQGATYRQFELQGFSNADQIKLYQWLWEGFVPTDGGGGQ